MFLLYQRAAAAPTSAPADGPALTLLIAVYLSIVVLNIAAYWRIFSKAGQPGWTVLVPIYGSVKLIQISGRSGWWLLAFLVPLLNIFAIVRLQFDLARVFGRGIGFGFGLLLLPLIFAPILGFGDAQYVGDVRRQQPATVLAAA
jgi:Family of unknown function (DUF5684)